MSSENLHQLILIKSARKEIWSKGFFLYPLLRKIRKHAKSLKLYICIFWHCEKTEVHSQQVLFAFKWGQVSRHMLSLQTPDKAHRYDTDLGAAYPAWPQDPAFGSQAENRTSQTDLMSTLYKWVQPQMVWNTLKNNTWNAAGVSLLSCGQWATIATQACPGPSFTQQSGTQETLLQCSHDSGEGSTKSCRQPECHVNLVCQIRLLPQSQVWC